MGHKPHEFPILSYTFLWFFRVGPHFPMVSPPPAYAPAAGSLLPNLKREEAENLGLKDELFAMENGEEHVFQWSLLTQNAIIG